MTRATGGNGRVNAERSLPMYMQVEEQLHRRIADGEWKAGEKIPSEKELCAAYGVSHITMKHALQRLVDRGVLVRQQGSGTYVRKTDLTAGSRSVRSFTAEVQDLGMVPSSRLLSIKEIGAPLDVAAALDLEVGDPVVRVRRVRLGDGEPIGVQTAFLLGKRFPGLARLDLHGTSLYGLLETNYGVVPDEARETFTVGRVTAEDAGLLKVKAGTPAFYVERTTFHAWLAFEYVASVMRGDRYRITLAIRNN